VGKEPNAEAFLSVDDAMPDEEGGPIARGGFNYQDEIAVGFLIEMLESPSLLKVHCETHDDVLLVYAETDSDIRTAEYVQGKASETDSLWSMAGLCARKNEKAGTSIFERSIARDKHCEQSRFRLVTLRPVVSALKMLTLPLNGPGREPNGKQFQALHSELNKRFPELKTPKGNGTAYWLRNCLWDQRDSEAAVRKANLVRLMRLSIEEVRRLLLEHADMLVDELCDWARAAGDAKWKPDRDKKIITHGALRDWWERRIGELMEDATATAGGKLLEKMAEAGLPSELVGLAADLRRDYAAAARTTRYLEPEEGRHLQSRVKSEVISLRARLVAGELDVDGAGFHALCLKRMDAISTQQAAGSEDRSAFLKGCMYDIADRCLLRFARPIR
jgi:hypothetical protein